MKKIIFWSAVTIAGFLNAFFFLGSFFVHHDNEFNYLLSYEEVKGLNIIEYILYLAWTPTDTECFDLYSFVVGIPLFIMIPVIFFFVTKLAYEAKNKKEKIIYYTLYVIMCIVFIKTYYTLSSLGIEPYSTIISRFQ